MREVTVDDNNNDVVDPIDDKEVDSFLNTLRGDLLVNGGRDTPLPLRGQSELPLTPDSKLSSCSERGHLEASLEYPAPEYFHVSGAVALAS